MALVVNTNVPSLSSQRHLMESRREMETAMERLSSGKRINHASDDAAGLAISQRMESQVRGLNMAIRNANDAISLAQTAEGSLSEVSDMLQRIRELSLQSVNGTNNDSDRASLDTEVQALKAEIDRISSTTTFNNQTILDGSFNRNFQIGYNASETFTIDLKSVATAALGLNLGGDTASASTNPTVIGGRFAVAAVDSGDVVIDGQEVGSLTAAQDIGDAIEIINRDVSTVTASAFNTVVAREVGTGILSYGDVAIRVSGIGSAGDADYIEAKHVNLAASTSLDEMIANINASFSTDEVVASKNTDGKLVLSNNTGATIAIVDESGTDGGYDGATGFLVDEDGIGGNAGSSPGLSIGSAAWASGTLAAGFMKLVSSDSSEITIDIGNKDASTVGANSDLAAFGFQRTIEDPEGNHNQVIGSAFGASAFSATGVFSQSTAGVADVIINGVEIYDSTMETASASFQGKLDMINAFTDETKVVASAYFERTYDMSDTVYVAGDAVEINGELIEYSTSIGDFVLGINNATSAHGLTATVNGQNLTLTGEGVQNVNIKQTKRTIADLSTVTTQAEARRATDLADSAQSITFGASLLAVGRILRLDIGAQNAGSQFTAAAKQLDFEILNTHSINDVALGFRNLLYDELVTDSPQTASMGNLVYAATNTLQFSASAALGSASITLSVVSRTASVTAFDLGDGVSAGYYGAIRLSSEDNSRITIELGEGNEAEGHGLREQNVGDTTFDKNSPTENVINATTPVSGLNISTSSAATSAITVIDAALETVGKYRADLGAVENRMTHTVDNLTNVAENTSAAKSRIEDADFASEAAALARAQILQQAGTAMLAQANAAPQNVLSLLG
ncbi:MAG TPA: hypothetical protein DIC49_03570 [Gammaproteobacteria bacterium]|nr:hypothetical protein [Gammaproteobacteria bacterium]